MLFLTLVLWCRDGHDAKSHEALVRFAKKMAAEFQIRDLLEHCADPEYISQFTSNNQRIIETTMDELRQKVDMRVALADRLL